jgi:hypothetical protein
MNVRLTQIDGKLPNLALMSLAHFHKGRGDEIHYTRRIRRDMFEPEYGRVYASAIFKFSAERLARFRYQWPDAIIGGTGADELHTVEQVIGQNKLGYDYSPYPEFKPSIGFTQRGCRMKCKFCVVPNKEGANHAVNAINDIWRGDPHPKKLHLLDNDFFGQDQWRERIKEIQDGGFKVCLNQGINVRLIDDEAAEALASIEYRDDQFQQRRIYTAWDNFKDEQVFFRGMDTLERAGIPPKHIMAFMLVGFDKKETWDRINHRIDLMMERGILPYPMVFENKTYPGDERTLKDFQRWAIRLSGSGKIKWADYDPHKRAA